MGARKFENKHGVGILLNKMWRKKTQWTEYINERVIATLITINKQNNNVDECLLLHTGYADQHVENFFRTIKEFTKPKKNIHLWVETSTLNLSWC